MGFAMKVHIYKCIHSYSFINASLLLYSSFSVIYFDDENADMQMCAVMTNHNCCNTIYTKSFWKYFQQNLFMKRT